MDKSKLWGSSSSVAPNIQSSADTGSAGGTMVKVEMTVNGNIIGTESGLRDLSVTMAKLVQDALKSQGTEDINMLRTV